MLAQGQMMVALLLPAIKRSEYQLLKRKGFVQKEVADMEKSGIPDGSRRYMNLCGSHLRELREVRHLSSVDFRKALQRACNLALTGVDLAQIEEGTCSVSDVELSAFARFFQVSPERLLWGERPPDRVRRRAMIQELCCVPEMEKKRERIPDQEERNHE
jgi:hypothetical protein